MTPLALSVGCPCGIGPEIAVAACASLDEPVLLVGDRAQLLEIARAQRVSLDRHAFVEAAPPLPPAERAPGRPGAAAGAAQLGWIDAALDLVTQGKARALITGPVSKKAIAASGAPGSSVFTGHTEHLQRRLGADEVIMAFWSPSLSTSLVTTHLPLRAVPGAITAEAAASAAFWLARMLVTLGNRQPTLAVAGLNPHAGEQGLLGDEEERIARGIELARRRLAGAGLGATLRGPVGAETAFRLANQGHLDGVVAMYHDQATIPMKLLSFGDAVNVSLALPIVRTSVDHGTAYELAGTGKADYRGLLQALALADRLSHPAG